jgi:hypothetical protein
MRKKLMFLFCIVIMMPLLIIIMFVLIVITIITITTRRRRICTSIRFSIICIICQSSQITTIIIHGVYLIVAVSIATKSYLPFGLGNLPAPALWLIWITKRLDSSSSIAEVAKRKANLVGTCESATPLLLLLSMLIVAAIIIFSKNGFVISVFKLRRLATSK